MEHIPEILIFPVSRQETIDTPEGWNTAPVKMLHRLYESNRAALEKISPSDQDRRYHGYIDVLERDQYALEGSIEGIPLDADIHVVVLLWRDEYQGHIYVWVSPSDPAFCFAIGIRNRIDYLSIKGSDRDIATAGFRIPVLLLEGARLYAQESSCRTLNIVSPIDVMLPLLKLKGFTERYIDDEYLGIALVSTTYVNEETPSEIDVYTIPVASVRGDFLGPLVDQPYHTKFI